MTTDLIGALEAAGFTLTQTGGGCRAMVRQRNGATEVITDVGGAELPYHGDWLLARYAGDWLADADATLLEDFDSDTCSLDLGELI